MRAWAIRSTRFACSGQALDFRILDVSECSTLGVLFHNIDVAFCSMHFNYDFAPSVLNGKRRQSVNFAD
jgi:hypothetical protein